MRYVLTVLVLSGLLGVARAENADKIYHNGLIITVNDRSATVDAIAIKDGRIIAVGDSATVFTHRRAETVTVDLEGKTVSPGFIDGHSHFINSLDVASQANCFSPPVGRVKCIGDVIAALQDLQRERSVPEGAYLIAYGYDQDMLEEQRHITAADLDPHFPSHRVIVMHVSLHGGVLNTAALKAHHITDETEAPQGGIIARKRDTKEPAGLLMETAFFQVMGAVPKPSIEVAVEALADGQAIYAAAGITTAQDGATRPRSVEILKRGADLGRLYLDVVGYPYITLLDRVLEVIPAESFGSYHKRFKIGGVKITTDGSPQGRTAYFTTPYLTAGPSGEQNWRGKALYPQDQLNRMVKRVYDNNWQLLVHCNGDAAIDMFLSAHEQVTGPDRTKDRRTTVIHSQFVRRDQLEKYAAYKFIPSFYPEHCFFFADAHIANRGRQQAEFISPMKTAYDMGLRCTNHTDFNVAPIDQLFAMWTAVNRITRSGQVIGADQRITPRQALRSLTIDAAWQYGEETEKGSLEVGKLADLVILSDNPLTIDPMAIKDIKVLETIKEGQTIYIR